MVKVCKLSMETMIKKKDGKREMLKPERPVLLAYLEIELAVPRVSLALTCATCGQHVERR